MNHPGVWIIGDLADDDRGHGMGIVIGYAGEMGEAQWVKPERYLWDYMLFGKPGAHPTAPDDTIEITILKHNGELEGFNQWLLDGVVFSMETMKPAYTVKQGLPPPDENSAMPATTFILSISIATASSSCASAVSRPRARSKTW